MYCNFFGLHEHLILTKLSFEGDCRYIYRHIFLAHILHVLILIIFCISSLANSISSTDAPLLPASLCNFSDPQSSTLSIKRELDADAQLLVRLLTKYIYMLIVRLIYVIECITSASYFSSDN